ncbi:MAG: hypothetical protein DCC43_02320 [Candidatus Brocadia sp.]|uniref:Uncharacterized protein n=1 Tax=Candidatus Brocadia fulgida TaxID=380242 RepID=A0A0M2UX51_9BACT|nr:MAG: hypothetical protein BROFUL_00808 [Candidatus Brocadia fulgida]MCC6325190.1 hypothetical protein [Candidatus Brocadia sp.]MCE7910661.1 hypothetical protein [Candidatus Brocadia sp. AMX3]MBV6518877.1 hypothetical protein [Candidatus Brocadia fulgida]MDG5996047.1 hypothetical protein [Candidatus Brocadia sp.]
MINFKKKINKKKIVSICPVGMIKTKCPSIRQTRKIRVKLLTLQRENNSDPSQISKLRSALKTKKNRGIAVDCETCSFNVKESTATAVSQ